MTSGRRDDESASPPDGAAAGDGDLLTSEDLFGDILDDPRPTRVPTPSRNATPSGPGPRRPIKVPGGEAGGNRKKTTPVAQRGGGEALAEDLAGVPDAFSEAAEAGARSDIEPAETAVPKETAPAETT